MSYLGAVSSDENKRCCVIDIGGGSTETIVGDQGQILFAESLSYGAVKMTEKFIKKQPTSQAEISELVEHLKKTSQKTWDQVKKQNPQKIVAVAGTPTSLAACEIGQFDPEKVENFVLTQDNLKAWIQKFSAMSIDQKKSQYPLGKRADVILAGTIILSEFLNYVGLNQLTVSTKGIRYGLAETILSDRSR